MMRDDTQHVTAIERAWLSLEGLSLGDAFGECFFAPGMRNSAEDRTLPDGPWFFTDDTMMAWSLVEVLAEHGTIDQDNLVQRFLLRFRRQPNRGYGRGTVQFFESLDRGVHWRSAATRQFDGAGSQGNGGAMRAAPTGAFFADDPDQVVHEARRSAEVTHAHADAQAGAIAIALAGALAANQRDLAMNGCDFLQKIHDGTPEGNTRDGIAKALQLDPATTSFDAAVVLGSGQRLLSSDTVPFALWCAARHLHNFEEAMWFTAAGLGDVDTTCAMVGGIVALSVGRDALPAEWLRRREPLED